MTRTRPRGPAERPRRLASPTRHSSGARRRRTLRRHGTTVMRRHRRKEQERKDALGNPQRVDEIVTAGLAERDVEPEEAPLLPQRSDALSARRRRAREHLRHANRLRLPQDASTAVMAGRHGDQAKAPAPRVVVRAHRENIDRHELGRASTRGHSSPGRFPGHSEFDSAHHASRGGRFGGEACGGSCSSPLRFVRLAESVTS